MRFAAYIIAATLALPCAAQPEQARRDLRGLRIAKASYIVRAGYSYRDERDFLPHVPYLIDYHAYLEAEAVRKGKPGQGYAAAWWWTLVYGAANFGLQCHRYAPGRCVGPLDVKGKVGSDDPRRNIEYHCQEMLTGYLIGYRDLGLCRYVMMPNRPHDWGRRRNRRTGRWGAGMFERTHARHLRLLSAGYTKGELER